MWILKIDFMLNFRSCLCVAYTYGSRDCDRKIGLFFRVHIIMSILRWYVSLSLLIRCIGVCVCVYAFDIQQFYCRNGWYRQTQWKFCTWHSKFGIFLHVYMFVSLFVCMRLFFICIMVFAVYYLYILFDIRIVLWALFFLGKHNNLQDIACNLCE